MNFKAYLSKINRVNVAHWSSFKADKSGNCDQHQGINDSKNRYCVKYKNTLIAVLESRKVLNEKNSRHDG